MNPDLFWIGGPWRGRLAIATRRRGGEWLQDEVRRWRRAGIDLVISVLESDEAAQLELLDEAEAADANGIRFISDSGSRCAGLRARITVTHGHHLKRSRGRKKR